jgi:hypothetical protein
MKSKHNGMRNTKESLVCYAINHIDIVVWWPEQKFNIAASRFSKFAGLNTYFILIRNRYSDWARRWTNAQSSYKPGSIPDGVIGIFYWYNHSGRTMTLGSNPPLTEMRTRNFS